MEPRYVAVPTISTYRRTSVSRMRQAGFWSAMTLLGIVIGAMVAFLPLNMLAGLVVPIALLGIMVVWALPITDQPPVKALCTFFFCYIVAVCIWPYYLAIQIPGAPLVEIRRLFLVLTLGLLIISLSVSPATQRRLIDILLTSRGLSYAFAAFLVTQVAALPVATSLSPAISTFVKNQLGWTGAFFVSAYIFSLPNMMRRWVIMIWCIAIYLSLLGIAEYRNEALLWVNHIPSFLQINDPTMIYLLTPQFRDGDYRVTGPFTVSLSFAEFMALAMPFVVYFILFSRRWSVRIAAMLLDFGMFVGIVLTQARVGLVCALAAHALMVLAFAMKWWRTDRKSLIAPALLLVYPFGFVVMVSSILLVDRLRISILGGGAQGASNEARAVQLRQGIPLILQRPLNGYGPGLGGQKLGFANPNGQFTIDNGYLAIGLDYGLTGLLAFVALTGVSAHLAWKVGMKAKRSSELELALCGFAVMGVWGVSRLVLAQQDNSLIVYPVMGMIMGLAYRQWMQDKEASSPAS